MAWFSILKIVAKVAVQVGAVDFLKGWLRRKAEEKFTAAAKKYSKQYKQLREIEGIINGVDADGQPNPPRS